jgi:hypothetical protein
MGIWLYFRKEGFEAIVNGEKKMVSKLNSLLFIVLLPTVLSSLMILSHGPILAF